MGFWEDLLQGAAYTNPITAGLYTAGDYALGGGARTRDAGGLASRGAGYLFGTEDDPGLLGLAPKKIRDFPYDPSKADIQGYQDWRRQLQGGSVWASGRKAPVMQAAQLGPASLFGGAQIDTGPQGQFRRGQMQLSQQLMDQAMGRGPSIADAQLRQAADRNMQQAMAVAASTRGMGGGGALRDVGAQRAQIGQQMAADSGLLRLQEQQQAQGLLSGVLGTGRGQDLGLAGQQAGFYQQAGLAGMGAQNQFALARAGMQQQAGMQNQAAALQQGQMNDQMVRFYLEQGLSLDKAQMQARLDMQQMQGASQADMERMRLQAFNTAQVNRLSAAKSAAQAASGAGG